jgi:hypothetical protein
MLPALGIGMSAVAGIPAIRCSIVSAIGVVAGVDIRFRITKTLSMAIFFGFAMYLVRTKTNENFT